MDIDTLRTKHGCAFAFSKGKSSTVMMTSTGHIAW